MKKIKYAAQPAPHKIHFFAATERRHARANRKRHFKTDSKSARLSIIIKCAATIIKCGTQSHKIYEGGNIQFPLGNTVAAAMVLVCLAERGAHLRITAAVDLHEVVLGGAGVAF